MLNDGEIVGITTNPTIFCQGHRGRIRLRRGNCSAALTVVVTKMQGKFELRQDQNGEMRLTRRFAPAGLPCPTVLSAFYCNDGCFQET